MVVEGVAVGCMLIMKLFPQTPVARLLHAWFVARPAAWLTSRTRRDVIFGLLVAGIMLAGTEFVLIAGTADVTVLLAWDLSLFVDALLVSWAAAASGGFNAVRRRIAGLMRRPRPRQRRARVQRRAPQPGNDDEPAPALLAA